MYGLVKTFASNGRISGSSGDYKHWPRCGLRSDKNRDEAGLTPAPADALLSDNDYGEATRLDFAATLAWGWRLKLGAGQKDLVRL
jgi:hypothetical protein